MWEYREIFHGIMPVPQNTIMDVNNVMKKDQLVWLKIVGFKEKYFHVTQYASPMGLGIH